MLIFERPGWRDNPAFDKRGRLPHDVPEFDGPSLLEAMKAHPDVSDLGSVSFVSQ
jgi:hypothetical protein